MSLSTLSRTTCPHGFSRTACWCVSGVFDMAQQNTPLPPPWSSSFWSATSKLTGSRSLTRSFLPLRGHLAVMSTFFSAAAGALGVVSFAQKLFSRCLPLSTTSSSPCRSRFAGSSSPSGCLSRARLCRASFERSPWSACRNSLTSRISASCLPACSFRALSCSWARYFLFSASSICFWCTRFSRMYSLSKMWPSGVATACFGGFSEMPQKPKGRKQSEPRISFRFPAKPASTRSL
mmetsp:Transcript_119980/g.340127  ORF Transcript_119980/g.340127 Transcript_119980/m.340127 type:complete len:235 (+) Transcript_119980:427-1131(+)